MINIIILLSFQDMILSQMDSHMPKNIARNVALKENVFMMLVCIELKIPLFVIGPPGSSKSLAKSIIENCMQGPSSSSELCKNLKQVSCIYGTYVHACIMYSTAQFKLDTREYILASLNTFALSSKYMLMSKRYILSCMISHAIQLNAGMHHRAVSKCTCGNLHILVHGFTRNLNLMLARFTH